MSICIGHPRVVLANGARAPIHRNACCCRCLLRRQVLSTVLMTWSTGHQFACAQMVSWVSDCRHPTSATEQLVLCLKRLRSALGRVRVVMVRWPGRQLLMRQLHSCVRSVLSHTDSTALIVVLTVINLLCRCRSSLRRLLRGHLFREAGVVGEAASSLACLHGKLLLEVVFRGAVERWVRS